MIKSKYFIIAIAVPTFMFLGNFSICAQETAQIEPNFELVLQTLIGSDGPVSKNKIPASLGNVIKKLKDTFPFSDYQLTSTYLERIENKGSFVYKGITDEFTEKGSMPPSFNEWALSRMKINSDSSKKIIGFSSFRFGTRLPILTHVASENENKASPVVNYEFVGFTIDSLSISENIPTLLGTLSLPNKNQMAFIILTVKAVE